MRNETDAEDVAQEAVLKALKHIRQFRAEALFSTWLIQITVNEARMQKRRELAHLVEPIVDNQDDEGNYAPREFADWSGKRFGRCLATPWTPWAKNTARFLCCAICST
jgi:RNA polymerase sigma-70 factor, ECF subfamily